jgi:acyl-[acyl carrier protein]--UDP-N-acetylglucosamine O-acyltransferase
MQRRGFSEDAVRRAKQIHKIFFRSAYNRTQAIAALEASELVDSPEAQQALAFIASSQRGLA